MRHQHGRRHPPTENQPRRSARNRCPRPRYPRPPPPRNPPPPGAQPVSGGLLEAAWKARQHACCAYSGFAVGAALEATDGRVFTGCNIENATYGLTVCAERVAIWKALSEGVRAFRRIAVVTHAATVTPPCGPCRQILWEFCGDIPVIAENAQGDRKIWHMHQLLPEAFDRANLK
ncbi:MAG: cytidine deaminase [Bryobacterales bacterium]|nr:cytidine deaminase [Bryobacterales bacterium]